MTAIEKAIELIHKDYEVNGRLRLAYVSKVLNEAKEMEKQQKIEFARHCLNKAKDLDILTSFMNVEQYYNETFKNTEL